MSLCSFRPQAPGAGRHDQQAGQRGEGEAEPPPDGEVDDVA